MRITDERDQDEIEIKIRAVGTRNLVKEGGGREGGRGGEEEAVLAH